MTSANRAAIRKLIEQGALDLERTVTLRGKGCSPAQFPPGWKGKCGDSSIVTWVTATKATRRSVPNTEFSGEVTIRITSNGGIPLLSGTNTPNKVFDEKRWPTTPTVIVGGLDVKAPPKPRERR